MPTKQGKVHPIPRKRDINKENSNMVELERVDKPRKISDDSNWYAVKNRVDAVSRWMNFNNSKRTTQCRNSFRDGPGLKTGRAEKFARQDSHFESTLDTEALDDSELKLAKMYDEIPGGVVHPSAGNKALLIYFASCGRSLDSELDLDFIESLLDNGADVNFTDKHGQAIIHEVSRVWHVDVAKFILEKGGNINLRDKYGRTPLHVAASVDYPEMVEFLVQNGATINHRTEGELQTPVHFAAKNDAVRSLKMLIKLGAEINDLDYKRRTPLHAAAELDRSETAKLLIELGAPAGVRDDSGVFAFSLMIAKMPPVAKEAFDQFHLADRANRKQYFFLDYLEPDADQEDTDCCALTPLEVILRYKQMDLIMHPVMQRLIEVKWAKYGKWGSYLSVVTQLLFVIICSVLGVTLPRLKTDGTLSADDYYYPVQEKWWRISLEIIACGMTLYFLIGELMEIRSSKSRQHKWKEWRCRELRRDLQFCHPRWPEERKYLEQEIEDNEQSGISYFSNSWNYFDWICYSWILVVIATRVLSLTLTVRQIDSLHPKLFSLMLIFIWVRLMKYFRAFRALGPFIVIVGHILGQTVLFGFLFFIFYIPYVCAFWMIFGGSSNAKLMELAGQPTEGWETFNNLMYSVWQITVVGNFPWDSLLAVDRLMAQLLCGTYLAISAIVLLNLFISMMSDTFQRVYDNANANAAMQQAATIISLEEGLSARRRCAFLRYIHSKCNPEELYYDDDSTEEGGELERMTHQIKDSVDELHEIMSNSTALGSGVEEKLVPRLRELANDDFHAKYERFDKKINDLQRDVSGLKALLVQVLQQQQPLASLPLTSPLLEPLQVSAEGRPHKRSSQKSKRKHRRERTDDSDDEGGHKPETRKSWAGEVSFAPSTYYRDDPGL